MALFPNFSAASTIRRTTAAGLTASSAMTTNLRTELITNGNWTEAVSGTFKSPVDADGRFFDIVVTEPSSVRWQWQVRNEVPGTICTREVLLSGAGEDVHYFSGDKFAWVEVNKTGADEAIGAGLLDLSPEAQDAHTNYVWGRGYRNSSGTSDGGGDTASEFFILDNGVSVTGRRLMGFRNAQGSAVRSLSFTGGALHRPAGLAATNATALVTYAGRIFDMIATEVEEGATVTIAIGDAGETGVFEGTLLINDGIESLAIRIS